MEPKKILLLVGPKGVGKSHIGNELSHLFDCCFLRVENIWLELKAEQGDVNSHTYLAEGIKRCLIAVSEKLSYHSTVIIESTGAFKEFSAYIASLQCLAKVYLIKVHSPLEQCMARIHARDYSLHIPVSDEIIENINGKAIMVNAEWDMVIENDPLISPEKLKEMFAHILNIKP